MQRKQRSSGVLATAADQGGPVPAELDRLFALSPAMLCIAGTDGYFKRVNPAFRETLGHTETVLLSRPFNDFVHPDDRQATLNEVRSLSKGNPAVHFENRYRHADGSYRWFLWNATPSPKDGLMYATALDITALKQASRALLRGEERLRVIVEAMPAPVVISRIADGEIVLVNSMMSDVFGVPTCELLGRKAFDFYYDPADRDTLMDRVLREKSVDRQEVRLKRSDGTPIWAAVSVRMIDFDDEPTLLSVLHDITLLKQMNEAASRFVPKDYLRVLQKDNIIDITLGDYVTGEMTVMFSDLRNFTNTSEAMTPEDSFAFINSYLGRVSPAVRHHNGFIIKYLGDGIHAIFPGLADDGVQAGIETLETVNAYNEYRRSVDRQPISIGIGVNTGALMVGMVGEQERLQGDCISDEVNLAARIEGLTKFYGVNFIISRSTYDRLSDPARYDIRYLDKVQVVGRSNALNLYEVYDADLPQMRALKQETQAEYEEAIEFYYDREFDAAQAKLFNILRRNPRDKVAWRFLVNATQMVESGGPVDWSGVTVMNGK